MATYLFHVTEINIFMFITITNLDHFILLSAREIESNDFQPWKRTGAYSTLWFVMPCY